MPVLFLLGAVHAAEPAAPAVSGAPGRGITLRAADGRASMNVRSRFVPRFDLLASPDPEGAEVTTRAAIATARLWVSGHVGSERLTYLTQVAWAARDYRDGAISPIFDAYVDYRFGRDEGVRVGQYFVRFDRLRTVREWALQMTDRPRPVQELTLDRDVGLTLYDDHVGGEGSPLALHLGAFGGRGIHQLGAAPAGGLVVGRVELRPLGAIDDDVEGDLENRDRPGLALGLAGAYNHHTTRTRSTTGPSFTDATADYVHLAADAVFKWRGAAVQLEGLHREALRDEVGEPSHDVAWARSGSGLVAQASWHAPQGVEAVARFSRLWAAPDTDPAYVASVDAAPTEVGAGLNVYRNGHRAKVQTTWIGTFDRAGAPVSHLLATQLDMTF